VKSFLICIVHCILLRRRNQGGWDGRGM